MDTDHHFSGSHLVATLRAMQEAKQAGFEVAVSNPCFELWLLLHHSDVEPGTTFNESSEVEKRLRSSFGEYNKTSIKSGQFTVAHVSDAIRRARVLEASPDAPSDPWPASTGIRVYRLMERVLSTRS